MWKKVDSYCSNSDEQGIIQKDSNASPMHQSHDAIIKTYNHATINISSIRLSRLLHKLLAVTHWSGR